ncbi:MAG: group II intron maturase-specific domain-containing protein, partial [Cyanobacteria bacterium J06639_14]
QLIRRLNPVIIGWCQYYSKVVSKGAFASLSAQLFVQLMRWAKRRHPTLGIRQIVSRYWLVRQGGGWVFQAKEGQSL